MFTCGSLSRVQNVGRNLIGKIDFFQTKSMKTTKCVFPGDDSFPVKRRCLPIILAKIYVILQSQYIVYYMFFYSYFGVPLTDKISSRFSINSGASASELLENREELFPLYYLHNILGLSSSSTQ